ncbi:deoxyribonuclease IV [Candidatus Poribacteria bacterium]|nr:deoxyribonuclease IV [Candidatus Poribacteria bacterium]
MILGAHVSAAGGLHNAIGNGEELGCDVVQIFIKNPNRWISKGHTDDAIDGFKEAWKTSSIQTVVVHDIHLTNLASPKPDVLKKSRVQFREQIQLADRLGIPYIVTHLGAHLETGEAEGLEMLSHSFNQLFEDTNDTSVSVLLETTAGQGTNLGYRFEHLRQIIDTSKYPDRLGVCLDTCHVFAAGYELRSEEAYHQTFDQFDGIIGLDRLLTFHLNDAKSEYNSRIDRHEHIGEGNLGITPFQLLVNDSRFSHTPMIIETPKMEEMHAVNLAVLRELVETG